MPACFPPPCSQAPLRVHALEWAGQSVAEKLAGLRAQLGEAGAGALLVTMLGALGGCCAVLCAVLLLHCLAWGLKCGPKRRPADEVAWLFNVRGGDVPYNPVCLSYGVVTADGATLYVDGGKVTPE